MANSLSNCVRVLVFVHVQRVRVLGVVHDQPVGHLHLRKRSLAVFVRRASRLQMGLFQALNVGFLVAVATAQATLPCSLDTSLWTVASSEDAVTLATLLRCSDGDFAVQWVGEVIVTETIRVTNGTSLNITGDGSGATANGDHTTQLFVVEGGSSMHCTDMTFANGNASSGGAMFVGESSVRFSGATAFTGNVATDDTTDDGGHGGAIFAAYSTLVFDGSGDATLTTNSASRDGGAIYVLWSDISWESSESNVFSDNVADRNGGAIYTHGSTVSWDGDGTHLSYNSGTLGGAVYAYDSTVSWNGDGTYLTSNSANDGGAIYADASTVSWDGDATEFSHNSADSQGGVIHAAPGSTVYWDGDGTKFSFNLAYSDGGAIYTHLSTVYWDGDDTEFTNNYGGQGGSIRAYDSNMSWIGDGTQFSSSSSSEGGAMYVTRTNLSWDGNGTHFSNISASFAGGAIRAGDSILSWHGEMTFFSNNSASDDGGAINMDSAGSLWCDGNTIFSNNIAGGDGGALSVILVQAQDYLIPVVHMSGGAFVGNTAAGDGGATYISDIEDRYNFEDITYESNSATNGGAVAASRAEATGTFSRCSFLGNTASKNGGAVETFDGSEQFTSSLFKGNSADCAVCGDGYSPSLAHTCTRCSRSRRQGLMVATVFAALIAVCATVATFRYLLSTEFEERNIGCFHRKTFQAIPLQSFKIIIVVWQILTQFAAAANVTYPRVYQDFLSAIDVINVDLGSMISAGCLWSGIDFHDRLLVSTIAPLLAIGMLASTYLVALRRNATAGHAIIEIIRHKHVTVLLFVTFLVYSSVSSMVFQTFACDSLDDGNNYLRADYRILCTTSKHLALQVYAGVMVVVYPVGIPLLYAILLFQHRDILANASADKAGAQPIASLWEAYKPERFYYEVIECGRRIMLTGVVVFIYPNDAAQIAITILIAVFFFAVFDILSPYTSEFDMWLSRGGQVVVFLSMFDLLLLKVDVSHERSQSQQAYAGVLVAGHVLMFLAISAEVVGICYASRRNRVMEEDKAFLSFPGLRARATSNETPVFLRSPAS
ncbi:probable extracellular nuclease [Ectocarpus siliculosus]|uniref:Probable extracellular nuclease n=1 Tax=Ectocarpus siliculosus TaxID=2880 RepID=D7FM10_ECTSI|nr:probable extracellular nuclease [Ectocarpus siliculosus]|eukprot:CBJ29835.1 probable extracellular nuclease [Ectocarpus siliculosus]